MRAELRALLTQFILAPCVSFERRYWCLTLQKMQGICGKGCLNRDSVNGQGSPWHAQLLGNFVSPQFVDARSPHRMDIR
jgi:hypothetical protein